eukprot:TRINITY_DN9245_c0_g1_i1.p1 TRINITY_DN9245_c0_g1~~TRINITY_DN9245_c0_g1_i1.p1  ORF type:complete len:438 (+),score=119.08 TRINITY_DN9245_c0_g1_i1:129-1316(+)
MATYVEFVSTEVEQSTALAKFLAKSSGSEEFQVEGKQLSEVVKKFLSLIPSLFKENNSNDKEVESFFFALFGLIKKLDNESAKNATQSVVSTLTTNQPIDERALLRLRILGNLYNVFDENPAERYNVFLALARYANATHRSEVVLPQFKDIEKRVAEWGLSSKQKRELYKEIRDSFRHGNKGVEAYQWSTKYLAASEGVDSESTEEAFGAALEAIRLPTLFRFDDLLELAPVKQLQSSQNATHSKVYNLLKIFVGENAESFSKFNSENPDFLRSVALDNESSLNKIRILSLASLSGTNGNGQFSYAQVAKSLGVDEDSVELYVVTAVSEGVIEARMDQLEKTVTITKSLQRTFTQEQWKQLNENLSVWTNNVKLLLKTLAETKQQAAASLQAESI